MTITEMANEKVKRLIGELQIQNIFLSTEIEQLKAEKEAAEAPKKEGEIPA